jgi:hypothetical protein
MAVQEAEPVQAEVPAAGLPPSSSKAPKAAANILSNKAAAVVEVVEVATAPVAQAQAVNSPRPARCS